MSEQVPAPWPPAPDLDSLKELVSTADIEGFIAIHKAPADEYDGEATDLFIALKEFKTPDITAPNLVPMLQHIWRKNFKLDDSDLALRLPAFEALADQIARFFGPEATPQVRTSSSD